MRWRSRMWLRMILIVVWRRRRSSWKIIWETSCHYSEKQIISFEILLHRNDCIVTLSSSPPFSEDHMKYLSMDLICLVDSIAEEQQRQSEQEARDKRWGSCVLSSCWLVSWVWDVGERCVHDHESGDTDDDQSVDTGALLTTGGWALISQHVCQDYDSVFWVNSQLQ